MGIMERRNMENKLERLKAELQQARRARQARLDEYRSARDEGDNALGKLEAMRRGINDPRIIDEYIEAYIMSVRPSAPAHEKAYWRGVCNEIAKRAGACPF